MSFTAAHRGGAGPPLLLLHGFTDTWRTWELVLPALQLERDVLALTLPGHAGGPPLGPDPDVASVLDALEAAMDDAGLETADIAGNSLGGHLALALAARGRAQRRRARAGRRLGPGGRGADRPRARALRGNARRARAARPAGRGAARDARGAAARDA